MYDWIKEEPYNRIDPNLCEIVKECFPETRGNIDAVQRLFLCIGTSKVSILKAMAEGAEYECGVIPPVKEEWLRAAFEKVLGYVSRGELVLSD